MSFLRLILVFDLYAAEIFYRKVIGVFCFAQRIFIFSLSQIQMHKSVLSEEFNRDIGNVENNEKHCIQKCKTEIHPTQEIFVYFL